MRSNAIKYIVLVLAGFLLLWGVEELLRRKIGGFAGSYPFVAHWDIMASEQEVIYAISLLNKTNPNFQVPNYLNFISKRDSSDARDYYLKIDLYYPDTKEIVHTWTRPTPNESITRFALVSLSSLEEPSDYRLINRDYWYIENSRQINKFERTIVDKIKEQIVKNRDSSL